MCVLPSLHGCVDVVDVEEHLDGGRRRRVAGVQDAEPVGLKEVRFISVNYFLSCLTKTKIEQLGILGPKIMLAEGDKHYPSRSGLTSPATAETNITKPVTKNNFGLSTG